jgi:hypothetical protein
MNKVLFALAFLVCYNLYAYAQTDSISKPRPFGFGLSQKYFSSHNKSLVKSSKQKKWIKSAIKSMKSLHYDSNIEVCQPHIVDIPDYQKISYRIQDCRKVSFLNGDTVLICLHSVHQDPKVGDVSIAMDSKNNVYVNFGHICGGMINFERMSLVPPQNMADFTENFVSDTDDEKWKKWK